MGKSRRAKSETLWFRRNRASEHWTWPTKSRWFDRKNVCPRRENRAKRVSRPRTWKLPMFSTWFGGSCSGLGRSISSEPRRFRLCPSGFPNNFSRQIFWYQKKKIPSPLHTAYSTHFVLKSIWKYWCTPRWIPNAFQMIIKKILPSLMYRQGSKGEIWFLEIYIKLDISLIMRKRVTNWKKKKTKRLHLGVLFSILHTKFEVQGCSGYETVLLWCFPRMSWSKTSYFLLSLGVEIHALCTSPSHRNIYFWLFFLGKSRLVSKMKELLRPGLIQCPGSVRKGTSRKIVIFWKKARSWFWSLPAF